MTGTATAIISIASSVVALITVAMALISRSKNLKYYITLAKQNDEAIREISRKVNEHAVDIGVIKNSLRTIQDDIRETKDAINGYNKGLCDIQSLLKAIRKGQEQDSKKIKEIAKKEG